MSDKQPARFQELFVARRQFENKPWGIFRIKLKSQKPGRGFVSIASHYIAIGVKL